MIKTVAILGAGSLGKAVATILARTGASILIANRSDSEALAKTAKSIGPHVRAATTQEVLAAEMVVLAVPFGAVPEAVRGAPSWKGRLVIDATNALDVQTFAPLDLGGRLSTQIVSELVPGARVVKAFNHIGAPIIASDPQVAGRRRVLFVSGDDDGANREVAALIEQTGFAPIVLGRLDEGGRVQLWGGPFTMLDLALQARK